MNKVQKIDWVSEHVKLSKASIFRLIKTGEFPSQIKLGSRSSAWIEEEIFEFINKKMEARDEK